MNKIILGISLIMNLACSTNEFTLLHYNIKELNSEKLNAPGEQLHAVKEILQQRNFDIMSLNEVQYDLPGVPSSPYKTKGQNLKKLQSFLGLENWNASFHQANTGLRAKRNGKGEYVLNPDSESARELADQTNFGTMPGQYSTGAITRYKIINETVISDLKWKEFNPNISLENYSAADGSKFPEDMALFDKNFSDILLEVNGKKLHLILLHAVPAHHFGNPRSPNYARNRDQLRFLEWYLTGQTDIEVELSKFKTIAGKSYIAVGDFNVEASSEKAGSAILKRLFKKARPWVSPEDFSFTNETSGEQPLRLMLDYILVSKDIHVLEGEIIHPKDKERDIFRKASDHYPVWGRFEIR